MGYFVGLSAAGLWDYASVFWGCHERLFEPTAAALAMDAHGAFDAAGFADCHGLPGLPVCLSS
jgi:hypothetical protein